MLEKQLNQFKEKKNFHSFNELQKQMFFLWEQNKNTIFVSPTGSGKTWGIIVCIYKFLNKFLNAKVFYFLPTNELIEQVYQELKKINIENHYSIIKLDKLKTIKAIQDANILIGTIDKFELFSAGLIKQKNNKFFVIFDEIDAMIHGSTFEQIHTIRKYVQDASISWSISATLPRDVLNQLKIWYGGNLQYWNSDNQSIKQIQNLKHSYLLTEQNKNKILLKLLQHKLVTGSVMIFVNSEKQAIELSKFLKQEITEKIISFYGLLHPKIRKKNLNFLQHNEKVIIITTDLMSRGISISHIQTVINYELPKNVFNYLHRAGRTGRFQQPGICINLVNSAEHKILKTWCQNKFELFLVSFKSNTLIQEKAQIKKTFLSQESKNKIKVINKIAEVKKPNSQKKRKNLIKAVVGEEKRKWIKSKIKTNIALQKQQKKIKTELLKTAKK